MIINRSHKNVEYASAQSLVVAQIQTGAVQAQSGSFSNVLTRINALRQICNLGLLYRQALPEVFSSTTTALENAQETFHAMLSVGTALCCRCRKDPAISDQDGTLEAS